MNDDDDTVIDELYKNPLIAQQKYNITEDVYIRVINLSPGIFAYIDESKHTPKIAEIAITQPILFQYLRNDLRTEELCLKMVRLNGINLQHIQPQSLRTVKVCNSALESTFLAFQYVPDEHKTIEMCKEAIFYLHTFFKYIPITLRTDNLCDELLDIDPLCILEMVQTRERCIKAITKSPRMLRHINNQTLELCLIATRLDKNSIKLIKNAQMRENTYNILNGYNTTMEPLDDIVYNDNVLIVEQ